MVAFYQSDYRQPGLTTDLPDENGLRHLLATGFRGSDKDFSNILTVLKIIGLSRGARILDFGANWGYGVWQLRQTGYEAVGYELSKPRAEFAQRLGVTVYTDWKDVTAAGGFDVAFSSHVLEHTPDPARAIRDQCAVLRPEGCLIALFPNGSDTFLSKDPQTFHRLWGRVHPVMLSGDFVTRILKSYSVFQGSLCERDLGLLSRWGGCCQCQGDLAGSELLVIARRSKTSLRVVSRGEAR